MSQDQPTQEEIQHAQNVTRIIATGTQAIGANMMQVSGSLNALTTYYEGLRAQWQDKEKLYLATMEKQLKEIDELKKQITDLQTTRPA